MGEYHAIDYVMFFTLFKDVYDVTSGIIYRYGFGKIASKYKIFKYH